MFGLFDDNSQFEPSIVLVRLNGACPAYLISAFGDEGSAQPVKLLAEIIVQPAVEQRVSTCLLEKELF